MTIEESLKYLEVEVEQLEIEAAKFRKYADYSEHIGAYCAAGDWAKRAEEASNKCDAFRMAIQIIKERAT